MNAALKKYLSTEKGKAAAYASIRRYNERQRRLLIENLGGKCVRCGFSDIRALQFDHINGGGKMYRGGRNATFYPIFNRDIDSAKKIIQLLCANCNWIKRSEMQENKKRREFRIE